MINIDEGKYWDFPWNWMSGCDNELECYERCWARGMAQRLRGRHGYPYIDPFSTTLHMNKMDVPRKRKKPGVYATFMGDPFQKDVDPAWIARALKTVKACPQHVFIWLTKRPENIKAKLYDSYDSGILDPIEDIPNLIIGVSVERPDYLDRISALTDAWAGPNLISFEPLLDYMNDIALYLDGIDAVIVGGESGSKARPVHPIWVQSILDQCLLAGDEGIPVYFKQWGEWGIVAAVRYVENDKRYTTMGKYTMCRYGKKTAGRLFDGRTYDGLHPLIQGVLDGR